MSNHEEHPPGGNATLALSVIVPVYNEVATIREVLKRIVRTPFAKEIIVVDDGSTDKPDERAEACALITDYVVALGSSTTSVS